MCSTVSNRIINFNGLNNKWLLLLKTNKQKRRRELGSSVMFQLLSSVSKDRRFFSFCFTMRCAYGLIVTRQLLHLQASQECRQEKQKKHEDKRVIIAETASSPRGPTQQASAYLSLARILPQLHLTKRRLGRRGQQMEARGANQQFPPQLLTGGARI